jgi:Tfp pilus assembly protein PilF
MHRKPARREVDSSRPQRRPAPAFRSAQRSVLSLSKDSLFAALLFLIGSIGNSTLAAQDSSVSSNTVQVIAIQGTNWWIAPSGASDWVLASTQMPQVVRTGDRLRTGRHTRLYLRTPNLGVIQIPPLSTIEISSPQGTTKSLWIRIVDGMIYFFHRGSPTDVEVQTRGASAAIRGTEFVAQAREDGGMIIQVVDGAVELRNEQGVLTLQGGEQGVAAAGTAPNRSPSIQAHQVIQWCLYYPAVLDPGEIQLDADARTVLEGSWSAYRDGDLLGALAQYPTNRQPQSRSELIYQAALWLSIGQAEESAKLLNSIEFQAQPATDTDRRAAALRLMMAATRLQPKPSPAPPELASEWLAESYYQQSKANLEAALEAAREATRRSPEFGFAWVRVAELEFSFGRQAPAADALEKGLKFAPRHAAGVVLQGFQYSARRRNAEALATFERALALDPGLGNAWLGRGLCRIRSGQMAAGLADLEVAAALEPQRALLRSYLGKAFASAGHIERADKEFALAKTMDPNDPTAWLYAALFDQQRGRINEGIRNLEHSKELNQNRQIFRSQHLLDEDQAVRGANLSALYRDAGFLDVSRREAVDAVNTDYGNYSAHLFLANSYNELRDPGQFELRYEAPWFNESLLANLLAPVGAGTLSQTVSEQEYSRLFERNGVGLVSLTEYSSNGDWIQSAAHYGLLGDLAYTVEEDYRTSNGQRLNNDLEQLTLTAKVKQQITTKDSLYFQADYYDAEGGYLGRVYDPNNLRKFSSRFRYEENQEPLLLAGYHRQWAPGQHTLVLASRLHDRFSATNPTSPTILISQYPNGDVTGTIRTTSEQRYRSELEIYSLELQHIAQIKDWTFIGGARSQFGQFETDNHQEDLVDLSSSLPDPLNQHIEPDMQRWTAYAYGHWQALERLTLIGGLSYDYLRSPENYRFAPVSDGEETRDQWSPKAGLIWKMTDASTLRAAYTWSLAGVSLDQSVRLEPSQVAGFNQSWRSLIPESVAGAQAGAKLENGSLEWDHRFTTGTYFAIRGDVYRSKLNRQVGVFELPFEAVPSTTTERLDYQEASLTATLNQLVGNIGAVGAQYRLSNAQLEDDFPMIPTSVPHLFPPDELKPRQDLESTLHQVLLFAALNHLSGFFERFEAQWFSQNNQGYQPGRPGDSFWQLNLYGGYRFPNRRAEIRLGLLNLAAQDYRLNPLNLTAELPRERTFVASLRLSF